MKKTFFLFTLLFAFPALSQAAECTENWNFENQSFAQPVDALEGGAVFNSDCDTGTVTATIGTSEDDGSLYIWKEVYYTTDGKNLSTNKTTINGTLDDTGKWIIGQGRVEFDAEEGASNYIAAYMCRYIEDTQDWKCGCKDENTCSKPEENEYIWHLEKFNMPEASNDDNDNDDNDDDNDNSDDDNDDDNDNSDDDNDDDNDNSDDDNDDDNDQTQQPRNGGDGEYDINGLEIITGQVIITEDGATISGKHFQNIQGEQALVIQGNNVTVEDNLFTNCDWCIAIQGADNITVIGNRFENTGTVIHSKDGTDGLAVEYNEVSGIGNRDITNSSEVGMGNHGWWSSNFVQFQGGNGRSISYNIVDNKGIDTPFVEDFININGATSNMDIVGNHIRGSSNDGSASSTGGAMVVDGTGSNFNVSDNIVMRTVAYGIASAGGSNVDIHDNVVYQPTDHVDGLSNHPHHGETGGSFSYGNTGYNGCGNGNNLRNNRGYTINANVGQVLGLWNVYDECGFEESGNEFPTEDPGWDTLLPDDMFAGLDDNYFSGRHRLDAAGDR